MKFYDLTYDSKLAFENSSLLYDNPANVVTATSLPSFISIASFIITLLTYADPYNLLTSYTAYSKYLYDYWYRVAN